MKERKQKYNTNNIFYGVIGIATLMLAIIGATFAYYTATATNETAIKGNMATINFDLTVAKVTNADDEQGGMIPMSNNMIEQALKSSKGICIDNNGNAVCQIFKITVVNSSTTSMFLDGYVALTGGSGTPEDVETVEDTTTEAIEREWANVTANETTMRWAQVFCSAETNNLVTSCTTAGDSTVRASSTISMTALGGTSTASDGFNRAEIKLSDDITDDSTLSTVTGTATINGNSYTVINKNYIRISDHSTTAAKFDRAEDITSALVYNQYLAASDDTDNNTGTSSSTYTDAQVYYIVVWLSENGHNQTAGSTGTGVSAEGFYQGKVTFISAQGSEVTATFADHVRVNPNT